MNSQEDCYPGFEHHRFESYEEELRAVRGLPSSRDYEVKAFIADGMARGSRERLDILRQHRDAYFEIAADAAEDAALREEAARRAAHIGAVLLPVYENELQQKEDFAAQLHQRAEQARRFESLWAFDPYTDPFLDSVEKWLREMPEKERKQLARAFAPRKEKRPWR